MTYIIEQLEARSVNLKKRTFKSHSDAGCAVLGLYIEIFGTYCQLPPSGIVLHTVLCI